MQTDNDESYSELRERLLYDEVTLNVDPGAQSEPTSAGKTRPLFRHSSLQVRELGEVEETEDEVGRTPEPLVREHRRISPRRIPRLRTTGQQRSGKRTFHDDASVGPADGVFVAICLGEALDLQRIHADWGSVMVAPHNINEVAEYDRINEEKMTPTCVVSLDSEVTLVRMFGERDVFLFRFGCLVAWGLPEKRIAVIKKFLESYIKAPLDPDQVEQDDMLYCHGMASSIRKDRVVLVTEKAFERMAHSYALAQSVKLTVFETSVDGTILKSKSIPEEMGRTGRLPRNMDTLTVSKLMGELFVQRCNVNLHTDILDTPEIFWEFDEYEEQYEKCRKYLDLSKRVQILNHRCDIVKDLYEMLQNEVQTEHGNYLEWIIIILIMLEVIVEVFRLFVDYYLKK